MKKEMYAIGVALDVFDDHIRVFFGDKNTCIDHFIKEGIVFNDEEYLRGHMVDGFCKADSEGENFVYIGKDLKDKGLICHELMHAILNITCKRNLYASDERGEQELECYLVGHVMGQVLSTPKKKWFIRQGDKWVKQK